MNTGPGRVQKNVGLASLTTIGLGGEAAYFLEVQSERELQAGLLWAEEERLPVYILGGGSNTIFRDEGFGGMVLKINTKGIQWEGMDGDIVSVSVAAGEEWDSFVAQTINKGLAGLECLSGIPGLVGATPIQNVGAYGQEVAQVIEEVRVWDRVEKRQAVLGNDECEFSYRHSRFKGRDAGRYVILGVRFGLRTDGAPTVRYPQVKDKVIESDGVGHLEVGVKGLEKVRAAVLSLRRSKSMLVDMSDPNSKSCGSFFTNPIVAPEKAEALMAQYGNDIGGYPSEGGMKLSAAWLVEQAGFSKGQSYKGVGISANHSLALINRGGTTADLLEFQQLIQEAVQKKFGVELVREPVLVAV